MLLGTRRGGSLLTYLLLTLAYFTLLGVMLIPESSALIALIGLVLGLLIVTASNVLSRRRRARRLSGAGRRLAPAAEDARALNRPLP